VAAVTGRLAAVGLAPWPVLAGAALLLALGTLLAGRAIWVLHRPEPTGAVLVAEPA
jgi:hypothetical protein